ncbi:MAG: alpha/beta hydrolase [Alphaproteobacteria bacterium]|jgi:pimeloyl-ACP methyl ester carboxylesterase
MDITVGGKAGFAATGGQPFKAGQPTIVFIHGGGLDHSVWALQTRYFAYHGRNVLAVDLPGHGRTAGPVLTTIEANADWVMALLDALDVETAALVGHSMGSLVAFDAAARYPARITALALLGTSIPMPVADMLLDSAAEGEHAAFDMVTLWGHSRDGQTGSNRAPGLWMTGAAVTLLERSGPGVLHACLKAANDYRHGLDLAGDITCPTLLLLGERDAMTPAKAAKPLAAAIPDARVTILPACGHMMMSEQPDQVLDELISIL